MSLLTDGDTGAALILEAHLGDERVILRPARSALVAHFPLSSFAVKYPLLLKVGGRGDAGAVNRNADVQLGNGNVQSEVGERLHAGSNVGWHTAADEVRLEANTVEGLALREQGLGDVNQRLGLGVDPLNVVVVDVKLDVGRGSVGVVKLSSQYCRSRQMSTYHNANVVFAQNIVPDGRLPSAILIEGYSVS